MGEGGGTPAGASTAAAVRKIEGGLGNGEGSGEEAPAGASTAAAVRKYR